MSNNFETPPADDGMIGPIQDMIHTLGGVSHSEEPLEAVSTANDPAKQPETPWYRNSPWYSDGEFWPATRKTLQLLQQTEDAQPLAEGRRPIRDTERFLPFRQVFDGAQVAPPLTEQKAVGALFDSVVSTYLQVKAGVRNLPGVEEDTVHKTHKGEHIEITISDKSPYNGADKQKVITIRKLETKGAQRGTIQDFATYFMQDGIVRRADSQTGRDLSNKKLFDRPRDDTIETVAGPLAEAVDALMTLGDLSYMDDLERLGLNNQPIGREELHDLLRYIDDLFTRGERAKPS
jgi:hypothetical protein